MRELHAAPVLAETGERQTEAARLEVAGVMADAKATEVKGCMLPCGVVGEGEPPSLRNGTEHVRLDGSRGSDKYVGMALALSLSLSLSVCVCVCPHLPLPLPLLTRCLWPGAAGYGSTQSWSPSAPAS